MRFIRISLLAGIALAPSAPAAAAEALKFGPPPAWVVPQAAPSPKNTNAPAAILLHDQQVMLEPGKISTFTELVFKILKPEGLAAGNLSIGWNPATDTVTVHKVEIRRAGKVIDVLGSGQTFTVLRRETNLEAAMLDGTLTANIQPEGLQEGDVVVLAATTEHADPVLKGHVETMFGSWGGSEIALGHARLAWPSAIDVRVRTGGEIAKGQQSTSDGRKVFDLAMRDIEPVIEPKNAPVRYQIGRIGEATDFGTWSDAAALMGPLFRTAAVIPAAGPLRDEVEKIRKSSSDAKIRAEQALQLVEQRVRYVALLMGQGSYVPASAGQTWSRRFGDCKAKTALLMAILHELGIEAEPVLVNPELGDAIADRLPMIALFNHVLVRAHIGGKTYWLDGTRTGDTSLDGIEVPDFGWGLPLVENAQLVHMAPSPLTTPNLERRVEVDATRGVFAPAPITMMEIYRGDSAAQLNLVLSAVSADQRTQLMREKGKRYFDGFELGSSSYELDKAKRELTITVKGASKLSWDDNGWLYVPTSEIAFKPDFDRPAGPLRDVPVAINHPRFVKDIATIKLPLGFAAQQKLGPAVHETLAGVEYARSERATGNIVIVESSERSIAPEIPYKDALAAVRRLKTLNDDDAYLRLTDNYRATQVDLLALADAKPASKNQFFQRGVLFSDAGRFDQAISDFTEALKFDPKDVWTLANRGIAYVWKRDFEKGERDIQAASAIDPENAVNLRGAGLLAELRNDLPKAVEYYTRSLQRDPRNGFAIQHRALALQKQGKTGQAISELDKAVGASPVDALLVATSAYSKAKLGKYDEAEQDLKAAEAIDPKLPSIIAVRAEIAEGRHDYKSAIEAYTKVLEQAPGDAYSLTHRALAYRALGEHDKALADSEAALKGAENTSEIRLLRANVFRSRGDRQAAIKEADLVIAENPTSDYAFVAAGRIYSAFGLSDKALKAFDQALAIRPDSYVYVNRAQIRSATDRAGRLADLDAALRLDPNNSDALAVKAWELTLAGDYKTALELYTRVEQISPEDRDTQLNRAIVLQKLGQTTEADRLIEQVRRLAGRFHI